MLLVAGLTLDDRPRGADTGVGTGAGAPWKYIDAVLRPETTTTCFTSSNISLKPFQHEDIPEVQLKEAEGEQIISFFTHSYVLIINNRPHRKLTSTQHGIPQPFRSRSPNAATKAC